MPFTRTDSRYEWSLAAVDWLVHLSGSTNAYPSTTTDHNYRSLAFGFDSVVHCSLRETYEDRGISSTSPTTAADQQTKILTIRV